MCVSTTWKEARKEKGPHFYCMVRVVCSTTGTKLMSEYLHVYTPFTEWKCVADLLSGTPCTCIDTPISSLTVINEAIHVVSPVILLIACRVARCSDSRMLGGRSCNAPPPPPPPHTHTHTLHRSNETDVISEQILLSIMHVLCHSCMCTRRECKRF